MEFQPHLTRRQTCEILNCAKPKFYNLIADKTDPLPAYKLGDGPKAEWRVDPAELKAWIERHSSKPTQIETIDQTTPKKSGNKPTPPPKMTTATQGKRWEMIIPGQAG